MRILVCCSRHNSSCQNARRTPRRGRRQTVKEKGQPFPPVGSHRRSFFFISSSPRSPDKKEKENKTSLHLQRCTAPSPTSRLTAAAAATRCERKCAIKRRRRRRTEDAKWRTFPHRCPAIEGDRDNYSNFSFLSLPLTFHPFIRQSTHLTHVVGVSCNAIGPRRGSRGCPQGRSEVLVIIIELSFVVAFFACASPHCQHRPRRVRRPRRGGPGPGLARRARDGRFRRRR